MDHQNQYNNNNYNNITTENSDIQQYLNEQSFYQQQQQQQQNKFHTNNHQQNNNMKQSGNFQNKKLLALVQLDIGNGTKTIKIHEGDDLRQISIDFCMKNNLSEECIDFLVQNIKQQINVHKSRKTSNNNSFSLSQSNTFNNNNMQNHENQKFQQQQQQKQQKQQQQSFKANHEDNYQNYSPHRSLNKEMLSYNTQQGPTSSNKVNQFTNNSSMDFNNNNNNFHSSPYSNNKNQFNQQQQQQIQKQQMQSSPYNYYEQQQQQQQQQQYFQNQQMQQQQQPTVSQFDNNFTNNNINNNNPHFYQQQQQENQFQHPQQQRQQQNQQFSNTQNKSTDKKQQKKPPQKKQKMSEKDLAQHYEQQYKKMMDKKFHIGPGGGSNTSRVHKSEVEKHRSLTPKIKNTQKQVQTGRLDLNPSTNRQKSKSPMAKTNSNSSFYLKHQQNQKQYVKEHQQKLQQYLSQKEFIIENSNKQQQNNNNSFFNKQNTSKDSSVYEQLYQNAMRKHQNQKSIYLDNQLKKEQQEIEELEECTFTPQISQMAKQLKRDEKIEDLLLQAKDQKQRQIKIGEKIKQEQEQKECTFSPYVSSVSRQLMQNDKSKEKIYNLYKNDFDQQHIDKYLQTGDIHERLHHQAAFDDIRKGIWQQQQYNQHYPHSPDLGPNKDRKVPEKTQKEFTERLIREKQLKEDRLEDQRILERIPIDKKTGQKLFHPKINKKDPVYRKVSAQLDQKAKDFQQRMIENRVTASMIHDPKGSTRPYKQPWDKQLRTENSPQYYPNTERYLQQYKSKKRSMTPTSSNKVSQNNSTINIQIQSNQNPILNLSGNFQPQNSKPQFQRSYTPQPQKNNTNTEFQKQNMFNINNTNNNNFQLKSQRKLFQTNKNSRSNSKNSRKSRKSNTTESPDFVNPQKLKNKLNRPQNLLMVSFDTIQPHVKEKLKKLYMGLDSDGDGIITAANIDLSTITPEELEVIQDILYEMEDEKLSLDFSKFTEKLIQKDLVKPMMKVYNLVPEYELAEDPNPSDYNIIKNRILKENRDREEQQFLEINKQNNNSNNNSQLLNQSYLSQSQQQQQQQQQQGKNLSERYQKIVKQSQVYYDDDNSSANDNNNNFNFK